MKAYKTEIFEVNIPTLQIFSLENIQRLGFFSWKPRGREILNFADITKEDIEKCLEDWKDPPERLLTNDMLMEKVGTVLKRRDPDIGYDSVFNLKMPWITPLYVAKTHFQVDLKRINFLICELQFLANRKKNDKSREKDDYENMKYVAAKVRGIVIFKKKQKQRPGTDNQFEKLVTQNSVPEKRRLQYLHIRTIGNYEVLFCSSPDAVDEYGEPAEIKYSSLRYMRSWLWQMIKSGCNTLVYGTWEDKDKTEKMSGVDRRNTGKTVKQRNVFICFFHMLRLFHMSGIPFV